MNRSLKKWGDLDGYEVGTLYCMRLPYLKVGFIPFNHVRYFNGMMSCILIP